MSLIMVGDAAQIKTVSAMRGPDVHSARPECNKGNRKWLISSYSIVMACSLTLNRSPIGF